MALQELSKTQGVGVRGDSTDIRGWEARDASGGAIGRVDELQEAPRRRAHAPANSESIGCHTAARLGTESAFCCAVRRCRVSAPWLRPRASRWTPADSAPESPDRAAGAPDSH